MKHLLLIEVDGRKDFPATADLIHTLDMTLNNEVLEDTYRIVNVAPEDIAPPLPAPVEQYLLFDFEYIEGFSLDFDAIFSLMDHLATKPLAVVQIFLRLSAVLGILYSKYYDAVSELKTELSQFESERMAYYSNEDCPVEFKKSIATITSHVKAEPTYRRLQSEIERVDRIKSRVYVAKDHIGSALEICKDFIKRAPDVRLGESSTDRSFKELADKAAKSSAEAEYCSEVES